MAMLEAAQGHYPRGEFFDDVICVYIGNNFGSNVLNALFTSLPSRFFPPRFLRMHDRNPLEKTACR